MKTLKILLCALALNSCGKDEGKKGSTQAEETKLVPKHSLSLQSFADLPECNEENANQLVYVVDEEAFYTCDGDWTEINIKMKTKTEVNQSVLSGVTWQDPITGIDWYLFGINDPSKLCGVSVGGASFIQPGTPSEIREALRNGIFKGFNMPVWTVKDEEKFVYSNFPDTDLAGMANGKAMHICKVKP